MKKLKLKKLSETGQKARGLTMKKIVKQFLARFFVGCIVGTLGEGLVGWGIRLLTGEFLWVYPGSPFVTTSVYVIPLWGCSTLIGYFVLKMLE